MSNSKSIISKSAEKISDNYSENPLTAILLTALSIAVPQVAIGKEAIDRAVTKIQKERFATLLDELAKGEKLLTPEIIESEEFIHSFVVVYRAAINTYQREKIRRFARILLTAIDEDKLATDTLEEFTKLLDSLTMRELRLLVLLDNSEKSYCANQSISWLLKTDLQQYTDWITKVTNTIWDGYIKKVAKEFKLTESSIVSILYRLQGMGLCYNEALVDKDRVFQVATTTHLFEQFSRLSRVLCK